MCGYVHVAVHVTVGDGILGVYVHIANTNEFSPKTVKRHRSLHVHVHVHYMYMYMCVSVDDIRTVRVVPYSLGSIITSPLMPHTGYHLLCMYTPVNPITLCQLLIEF